MSVTKVDKYKYRIFISDGINLDGSRRRHSKTVTTDLKGRDLERFLTLAEYDFEDEIKATSINYNDMANDTFFNYTEWWLSYIQLTEQTVASYKHNLKFINIYIGNKKLSKISKADILELLELIKNKKHTNTGKPISGRTVKNHINVLKSLFKTAIELDILQTNPTQDVKFTVENYQLKDNFYDTEDINRMIMALEEEPVKYKFAILFTLATGVRLGELLGLRESDFDFLESRVEISKALSETKGSRKLGPTKNKKSRLQFYPKELNKLLEEHLENEEVKKEMFDVENDFIFTSEEGGLMPKGTLQGWFKRFLVRKELKTITFHGLRHTSATMLLSNGVNIKNVAERLGHSKASTTSDIYAHAIPRIDKEASDIFSNIFNGSISGSEEVKLRRIK